MRRAIGSRLGRWVAAVVRAGLATGVLASGLQIAAVGPATADSALTPSPPAIDAATARLVGVRSDVPPLGPAVAKGIIVWSHGRSVHAEDSAAPSPPYLSAFVAAGFDVLRFDRPRRVDTLHDSGAALAGHAERLRAQGYRRVVLAGQSFGAFLSLIAAGRTDAVDAVIATAPAAYGSFADAFETWRYNATALYGLLQDVRSARVLVALFHADAFDPGGRGERALEILSAKGLPHRVIDQPADLVGHGAASTGLFVRRFGACLVRFAEAAPRPGEPDCESAWGRPPRRRAAPPVTAIMAGPGRLDGQWSGFYLNGRTVAVTVRRSDAQEVEIDYALGAGLEPAQRPTVDRRIGRWTGAGEDAAVVFEEAGRNPLRLIPQPDGRLQLRWREADGDGRLDAMLHPVGPSTVAERR